MTFKCQDATLAIITNAYQSLMDCDNKGRIDNHVGLAFDQWAGTMEYRVFGRVIENVRANLRALGFDW